MYGKIFRQIYASSIAEDYMTRFVFMDLIVLADSDGVVDMTQEAISRATNVPIEIVNCAVNKLCLPDKRSRSPEADGARLRLLDDHRDWGWQIVNYAAYREMRDDNDRKTYMRNYMRNYRKPKTSESVNSVNSVNFCKSALADGSPSSSPSSLEDPEGGTGGNKESRPKRFEKPSLESVKLQASKIGLPDIEAEKFYAFYESKGWVVGKAQMKSWCGALSGWKLRWQESPHIAPVNGEQTPSLWEKETERLKRETGC